MQQDPSAGLNDRASEAGVAPRAGDANLSTHWSAVRGELEVFAILTQSLTTSSRLAAESLSRLERDSAQRLQDFQARQARIEEEIDTRMDELHRIRRQIEGERLRAQEAERENQAAREAAERQVAALIASGQRHAEELVATAQRRAAETERDAVDRRTAILAESELLERQVRDLDDRSGRLLDRPQSPSTAAGGFYGATTGAAAAPMTAPSPPYVPPTVPAEPAPPPMDEPVRRSPVLVDEDEAAMTATDASESSTVERDRGDPYAATPLQTPHPFDDEPERTEFRPARTRSDADQDLAATPAAPRPVLRTDEDVEPEVAGRPAAAELIRPTVDAVPATAGSAPPSTEDVAPVVDRSGPATTTLMFYEVPGFQAVLALERALKSMPHTRDVTVGEFDERRLKMDVTHEMGDDLPQAILGLNNLRLELLRTAPDRAEFAFKS